MPSPDERDPLRLADDSNARARELLQEAAALLANEPEDPLRALTIAKEQLSVAAAALNVGAEFIPPAVRLGLLTPLEAASENERRRRAIEAIADTLGLSANIGAHDAIVTVSRQIADVQELLGEERSPGDNMPFRRERAAERLRQALAVIGTAPSLGPSVARVTAGALVGDAIDDLQFERIQLRSSASPERHLELRRRAARIELLETATMELRKSSDKDSLEAATLRISSVASELGVLVPAPPATNQSRNKTQITRGVALSTALGAAVLGGLYLALGDQGSSATRLAIGAVALSLLALAFSALYTQQALLE